MPPSATAGEIASNAMLGKKERLVAAARDLLYRQGVEHTTLADIAETAEVPLGNVYYYFKTKDDLVAAVVQTHVGQLRAGVAALELRHRSPKARLKALVGMGAEQGDTIARYGCPFGTLSSELTKRAGDETDPLAAELMHTLVAWAEEQFRALGRRDARDLAVELVVTYQGSAVVSSALGEPQLFARQTRRLQKWIDALQAPGPERPGSKPKGTQP